MLSRALLLDADGLRLVTDLEVPAPGSGEVTVRLLASGICHSDLNVLNGSTGAGPARPAVLGHEAAGVIEAVGPACGRWHVGDHVAVLSVVGCGHCRACRSGHPTTCSDAFRSSVAELRWRGTTVHRYANVASFSEFITVSIRQLVDTTGIPPAAACLIGCAVTTGFGVVANIAQPTAADRVAVLGVGGIGVMAIQAARLTGAEVTAVDVNADRKDSALRAGANVFVHPADLTGEFDAVVECSGAPAAIESALRLTAPGGTTALVGLPPAGFRANLDVNALMRGRRIVGSFNGDILPTRDLPVILEHLRAGRLDLSQLAGDTWPLEQASEAIAAVSRGAVLRPILTFS